MTREEFEEIVRINTNIIKTWSTNYEVNMQEKKHRMINRSYERIMAAENKYNDVYRNEY